MKLAAVSVKLQMHPAHPGVKMLRGPVAYRTWFVDTDGELIPVTSVMA